MARRNDIIQGLRDGIPIAMGYFAVAFSLGIIAKQAGLTAAIGFVSSFFTRASAGEYGVYTLVAAQAAYVEIVAMCLVTNLRYMLMSAALSQKIAPACLYLLRSTHLYAALGFGLCGRHRGRRHAAYCHRGGTQRGTLRHVSRHHHAPGAQRPLCALCHCSEFRAEWCLQRGASGKQLEQRHADNRADGGDIGRRGLVETH